MIHNVVRRHIKIAAGKPYLEQMGLTKTKAYAGEAAMLYSIEADANKSKYYEMIIVVADDGTATLHKANGRLGSKPVMQRPEVFRDLESAKRKLAKIKRSKITGRSHYIDAFESKVHKLPDGSQAIKGQYPMGLSQSGGSWRNQEDMIACKPILKKLTDKIDEAVADADNADMNAVLDDLMAASVMTQQLGRSSMAEEIKKKIKAPLARLQGGGRHRVDPVKTIRELKTLSRYIKKQMSTCMTASVLERVGMLGKTASDPVDPLVSVLGRIPGVDECYITDTWDDGYRHLRVRLVEDKKTHIFYERSRTRKLWVFPEYPKIIRMVRKLVANAKRLGQVRFVENIQGIKKVYGPQSRYEKQMKTPRESGYEDNEIWVEVYVNSE